jgi:pimeloyl-ACP methyl ester carboxylesterase
MESVTHDGRTTAYRLTRPDAGGPTALYVHGSGGTHRVWAAQYGPEGPTHPAVALDLSGHGESADVETEAGLATLEAYAADVAAVARETNAAVLVGNSLGGAVVQHLLLEGAYEPDAAVLAGSGAKLAVRADLREWLATDFERAVEFLHQPGRLFHDPDERLVERSAEQMRATGRAVTARDFRTSHAFDVRDRVGEIAVPVLAVVGEDDGLTPVAYHEFFASRIPDCRLAVIPDAAHLAMVERPAAFSDAVGEFLADLA